MKKLNTEEIKTFAYYLGFTESEAKEIIDIFYNLKTNNSWKIDMPLNDIDEYIREWENHWHREANWQEYYNYEKENCLYYYADTAEEAEAIFESLKTFKERVLSLSYELSSGLIAVVC